MWLSNLFLYDKQPKTSEMFRKLGKTFTNSYIRYIGEISIQRYLYKKIQLILARAALHILYLLSIWKYSLLPKDKLLFSINLDITILTSICKSCNEKKISVI